MPFTIDLEKLNQLAACEFGLDHFLKKSGGKSSIVYPNGWTMQDSERVATESPVIFMWLVSKEIIPITAPEAYAIVQRIHGSVREPMHESLKELSDFNRAARTSAGK